jgi:hypothetical protein
MKISKMSVLLPFAFAMCFSLFSAPAHAQATRTWISGVGDDVNPCSRTAPCKTWAGAISKTANGGEIDALDPGGFGGVTITKSITLDGGGGQVASILVAGTNGINVSAQSTDIVTIKNLRIQGLRCATAGCTGSPGLTAIQFNTGAALVVDNLEIYGFANQGINFTPNQATASTLSVQDTLISNCGGGGVVVAPTGGGTVGASITRSRVYNSLLGFKAQDNAKLNISFSVAANNTNNGVIAVSASAAAEANVWNSILSNNGLNGVVTSGANATIRIAYTSLLDNGTGINTGGGGTVSGTSPATNVNAGNTTPGAPNGGAVALQ